MNLRSRVRGRVFTRQCAVIMLFFGLGVPVLSGQALADAVSLYPTTMPMTSSVARMISYRHQNHMWMTSDGGQHMMINQGSNGAGTSLSLFSSFDSGQTWQKMMDINNTSDDSTSDGVLSGDDLFFVYSTATGELVFADLRYSSTSHTWELIRSQLIYYSPGSIAIAPAVAVDSKKRIWCSFAYRNLSTDENNIRLLVGTNGGQWYNTKLIFGTTDIGKYPPKSARPVPIPGGIGMVYTDNHDIKWAYRLDDWTILTPWAEQIVYTHQPPYDIDPYQSHFSVAVDELNNVHIATVEHQSLLYLKHDYQANVWNPPSTLSTNVSVAYVQTTIASGKVFILFNALTWAAVVASSDHGDNFSYVYKLLHDLKLRLDYTNPRVETPDIVIGDYIPTLEQYEDKITGVQYMMYYSVPVNF
jgi:hypothetical protein